MDATPSPSNEPMTQKASRRFVIGFLTGMLILAFLAALSIKSATENAEFQEEVQNMRERYDPSFKRPDTTRPATTTFADSTSQN